MARETPHRIFLLMLVGDVLSGQQLFLPFYQQLFLPFYQQL